MNNLSLRKIFLFGLILTLLTGTCDAQIFKKNGSRNTERGSSGKSQSRNKPVKVKGPGSVVKAKRKQASNDRKLKKNYARIIKRSQKRTIDIQTPEVQTRMKQNQKNSSVRDKAKKNKVKTGAKKAGKKYK